MEKLLKVKEVKEALSLSEQHVYKMIRDGALKAIRVGAAIRVRESDLLDYIEANATKA